jgi:hypothetical protein
MFRFNLFFILRDWFIIFFTSDKKIIENVKENDKEDEVENDSSILEPVSHNDALKTIITLNNFVLQYEDTTLELLNILRKVREENQGDIDFKRKHVN